GSLRLLMVGDTPPYLLPRESLQAESTVSSPIPIALLPRDPRESLQAESTTSSPIPFVYGGVET
ncbi:hypothetical protein U1Q18_040963, partial [Sarracenia purpurea var. burkii]